MNVKWLHALACVGALAATPLALAQDAAPEAALDTIAVDPALDPAPEPPAAGPAREEPALLEEIVVTAQKRAQSLQKVPLSVGVVSGETLAESGNYDAGALENFVPNVEIDIDPQAPVIGIRGFATETDNVGFEPSVGLVMDELALGRPEFIPDGLFDLERIEVLRGSQGTLFGKNTIAGVINFLTVEPEPAAGAGVNLTAGDPQQRRAEAMLNLPLGAALSTRLAGVYWDREGDVANSTLRRYESSLEQKAARVKIAATPGERWKLALSAQGSQTSVDYAPWQLYDVSDAALAYAQGFDAQTEDDPLDFHTAFDRPGYVDRRSGLTRALVEYQAGDLWGARDVSITTVIGHAGFDIATIIDADVSAADIIVTDFRVDYAQDSVEIRPAGISDSMFGLLGPVDWTLGFYASRADLESHLDNFAGENLLDYALSDAGLETLFGSGLPRLDPLLNLLPTLRLPLDDQVLRGFWQESESYALFGQASWKLSARLATVLGLRFNYEEKRARFQSDTVGIGLVGLVLGVMPFEDARRREETDVSPKLGLQYEWSRDLMAFVTYTRGYKSGGFNATATDNTETDLDFEPEKARAWELGYKSRLLARGLSFNGTLYRTEVSQLQVVDFDGTTFQTRNAGEARLQGVELEAQWRPAAGWFSLTAALALSDAEYTRYREAPSAEEDVQDGPDEPESTDPNGDNDPDEDGDQDLSGRTLANAPKLSGTLSPMLSFALPVGEGEGEGLGLRLGLDLSYRGDQYSAQDLDSHSFQEAYTLVGARIAVGRDDGRWLFTVNGNNLTDEQILDLVFDHSVFADSYVGIQIPGRSLSATLTGRF